MNEKLNIQDLVDMLAERHGMERKDADGFVREFFLLIEESLEKDKYVKIRGLGTFKLIEVGSRESVNVNTGERFEIQGHTKVSFTPEPALKDIINRPFSHFETVVLNSDTVLEDTPLENEAEEEEEAENRQPERGVGEKPEPVVEEKAVLAADDAVKKELEAEPEPEAEAAKVEEVAETVAPPEERTVVEAEPLSQETKKPVASSALKYFVGIILLVMLLCGGAVVFTFCPDWLGNAADAPQEEVNPDRKGEEPVVASPVVSAVEEKAIEADSLAAEDGKTTDLGRADSVAAAGITTEVPAVREVPKKKNQAQPHTPQKKQKKVAAPVKPDSVGYTIVGTKTTYTIQEGETLTRVALRFYGTKALWPYIVKHNRDVIKNPDNVPYGTTIKIPELAKKQ